MKITRRQFQRLLKEALEEETELIIDEMLAKLVGVDSRLKYAIKAHLIEVIEEQPEIIKEIIDVTSKGLIEIMEFLVEIGFDVF